MATWFLLLNSDHSGELIKGKVENGYADIKKKLFMMNTANPINVTKGIVGKSELFIIRWDKIKPADNIHGKNSLLKEVEEITPQNIERIKPMFDANYDMTPEQLRKMMGMKILGNMIKTKKETDMKFLFVILGLAVVAILSIFALQMFGIVKLW